MAFVKKGKGKITGVNKSGEIIVNEKGELEPKFEDVEAQEEEEEKEEEEEISRWIAAGWKDIEAIKLWKKADWKDPFIALKYFEMGYEPEEAKRIFFEMARKEL